METVLKRAKSTYDLVVVNTPPLTAVSDAFPLLGKVNGVVIVGRVGRNRRDVAERLHETLSGAGAPLLGVIANGFKARRNAPYAYAYDYSPRTRVILFGSHARGEAGKHSDLDFLVIEPSVDDVVKESARLRRALRTLDVFVDVVVVSEEEAEGWRDV